MCWSERLTNIQFLEFFICWRAYEVCLQNHRIAAYTNTHAGVCAGFSAAVDMGERRGSTGGREKRWGRRETERGKKRRGKIEQKMHRSGAWVGQKEWEEDQVWGKQIQVTTIEKGPAQWGGGVGNLFFASSIICGGLSHSVFWPSSPACLLIDDQLIILSFLSF